MQERGLSANQTCREKSEVKYVLQSHCGAA